MADFNLDAVTQAQDHTGDSRGYTSGKQALAGLFENVGNLFNTGVKVADQNNLQNQKQQIEEGVSNALNDWGFRTEANDSTGTPKELQDYATQLEKVKKAYTSGALKDSNFQMRIDALSRKVRLQYPGYQEEIDSLVNSTLGRSTANDLRKQLMQEWDTEMADKDADEKKYQSELADWREKGLYSEFPDFEQRQASGNPYSKEEIRLRMGKRISRAYQNQVESGELELKKKRGEDVKLQTEDAAYRRAAQVSEDIIRVSANDTNVQEMIKRLQETAPKDWNDQSLAEVTGAVNQLELKAKTAMLEALQDPVFATMDKTTRDNVIARGLEPITAMKDAIVNKDTGLINIFKTMTDTQTNRDMSKLLGSDGTPATNMSLMASKSKQFEALFGPEAKQMLMMDAEYRKLQYDTYNEFMKFNLAENKSADAAVDEMNKGIKDPAKKAELTRNYVTTGVKLLTNPKTTDDGVAQLVDNFFGEGNANFLEKFSNEAKRADGRSERVMLFEKLFSPLVTKAVMERAKSNPDLAVKYKDSMGQAFQALFAKDIMSLKDTKMYSDWVNINYNPQTMQFEYKEKNLGLNRDNGIFYTPNEMWKASQGKKSVDNLNKYLLLMKPAIEGVGQDPQKAALELMQANGVFEATPQGSFWKMLGEKVLVATGPLPQGKSGRAYGEMSQPGDSIFNDAAPPDSARKQLLDFIGVAEGADYNTLFGGAKMPLTKMTIGEASMMADYNRAKGGKDFSTAMGKYQIIQETLQRAMKGVGLTNDDLFSEQNQDKLANWIIDNEGGGGTDAAKLSAIWASLPKDASGAGTYDGVGMNKARVSWDDLQKVLGQ